MTSSFSAHWHFRSLLAWSLALAAAVWFVCTTVGFTNTGNLFALVQTFSVLALVGSGLSLVMLVGEFDLSIAGVFPLAGLVAVKLNDPLGAVPAIVVAVVCGAVFGLLNGLVTATFRIPSLAVTVGSMVLATGLGFAVAAGQQVQATHYETGLRMTLPIGGVFSWQSLLQIVLSLGIALVVATTWFGRFVYAVGSDADRARSTGVPVTRSLVIAFVVSGVFAAVGGSLQSITLATGTPGADETFLLQAATAAILGGIALTGGKGKLVGVLGAAALLSVIGNGLSLAGTNQALIQLVNGVILLLVVVLDRPLDAVVQRRARRSSRALPVDVPVGEVATR